MRAVLCAHFVVRGGEVPVKCVLGQLGAPRGGDHDVEREEAAVVQLQPVEVSEPRRHVGGNGQQPIGPSEPHGRLVKQRGKRALGKLGEKSHLAGRLVGDHG